MVRNWLFALAAIGALSITAQAEPQPGNRQFQPIQIQPVEKETELALDTTYAEGTRLKSTVLGVSFVVPASMSAQIHADSWNIILKSASSSVVGALLLQSGIDADMAAQSLNHAVDFSFAGSAVKVNLDQAAKTDNLRTTASYKGEGVGMGLVLRGAENNALVAVIAGSAQDQAGVKAALEALEKSVQISKPQHQQLQLVWKAQVLGQRLTAVDEAAKATFIFDLLKDGSYAMSAAVGTQVVSRSGSWRIEIGLVGGLLALKAKDGSQSVLRMVLSGQDLMLEGLRVTKQPTPLKSADQPAVEPPVVKKPTTDPNWKSDVKEVEKLEGNDVQFEVQYGAGTRLKIDLLGISFKIPENCIGGASAKISYFLFRPQDQRGLGMIMIHTGVEGIENVAALLAGQKDLSSIEQGLVVDPDGQPKIDSSKVTMRHTSAAYVCLTVGIIGPSKNTFLVSVIGLKEDEAKLKSYSDSMVASLQFAKPADAANRKAWMEGLCGFCLTYFHYKVTGAGTGNSMDSSTTKKWHFGSDGTYYYTYHYEGSGSVKDSGGYASQDDKQDKGTWKIEFGINGAFLYLTNEKGEVLTHVLQFDGKKVTLDGQEVSRSQSDVKK